MKRLRGAGDFARWFTIPFALVMLAASVRYLSLGPNTDPGAEVWSPLTVGISIVFGGVALFALARAPMLGIWAGCDTLLVRSWFATWRIPRRSIVGIEVLEYFGAIAISGDPLLRMPVVRRAEGRDVVARGIVAGQGAWKRQATALRVWLGTGELPHPDSSALEPRAPRHGA